jgi:ABC-type uncharacterized transport system substrate-binding protein
LGWVEGVNLKIEYRRVFGESERIDSYAKQLVDHQPDLLVGVATPAVTALLRATRTIPVVFTEFPIRSAAASFKRLHIPVATPRDLSISRRRSAASGWSCCGRSRRP